MADNKYKFFSRFRDADRAVQQLLKDTASNYRNKYYNVWMSKFKWSGLDEETKEQEQNYIMRQLWKEGSVWIRNIEGTDMIALCPFAVNTFNYLDFPETVTLINKRGASKQIIPDSIQVVNVDGALLYCTPGHDSISRIVDYYVDRIAQVEVLINNNLKLQNMPFLVGCDESNKKELQDIVDRILNGEVAVFASMSDVQQLQALMTTAPYLLDKLKAYQVSIENELLTVLGINNSGTQAKKAQMLVDEVNANNDVINDYGTSIVDEMKAWLERANKVLNRNISIEAKEVKDSAADYEDASIKKTKEESENV